MNIESMVEELLEIEETNKIFYLTSQERREFQYEVMERIRKGADDE